MSDLSKIIAWTQGNMKRAKANAADIAAAPQWVETVMDAYPAISEVYGVPYTHQTVNGEKIALQVAARTGVSAGRVRWALAALQQLAASGQVSPSTYNPALSLVNRAAASVASTAKKTAKAAKAVGREVVPEFVQKAAEGAAEGVSATGDLLRYLPWLALAAGAAFVYVQASKGGAIASAVRKVGQ